MTGRPPLLARLLLHLAVPARDRQYVLQDLGEEFQGLLADGSSPRDARRWYWRQVLSSIPPSLARKRHASVTPDRRLHRAAAALRRELLVSVRTLRKQPLFTAVSVTTLALGIGATTAMFSVIFGVLWKPLPYDEPEQLVSVWHTAPGFGMETLNQTAATYFTYREEHRVFDDFGLWDNARVTVTGLGKPEQVEAILVTDGTFPALRVHPMLGRLFTAADDAPGAGGTVVLSHGHWQRRFGSDRSAVGKTMTVNGRPFEIIGVLPPGFRFLDMNAAAFFPFRFDRSTIRGMYAFSYQGLARLRPGTTIEEANADVERMIPMILEKFPGGRGVSRGEMESIGFGANVLPLKDDVIGDISTVLWVLFGTVALVLIIACANVANLFLVRAEGRQQELAIRTALGAGRVRLAQQVLSESVVIGLLGGVAGVALAYGAMRLLTALRPERLPRLEEIGIDSTVLLFSLGIALGAGLLFGLFPLAKLQRIDVQVALKEAGRGSGQSRERQRARSALVVSQLALALVLLIGSGLMVRSLTALLNVHPGFEHPEDVLALRITIPRAVTSDPEATARAHQQILEGITRIPGVVSAGMSSSVSMDGYDDNNRIYVEEFPVGEDEVPPGRQMKYISPGYFETMRNRLLAGRMVTWEDIYDAAPVAMVTENVALEHWETPAAALGKRIAQGWQGPWYEIVGVVGDVHDDGVDREATPIVYWPMIIKNLQGDLRVQRSMGYAIRSVRLADPGFVDEVRQAVWAVNSDLPLARVQTLEDLLARSTARTSFTLTMLGIAAAAAVLLGMIGVYGVISYVVAQRTREIGVRMAFGATRGDIRRLVLWQGGELTAVGIGLGVAGAAGLTRLMSALLFGVRPFDLVTYAFGVVVIGLIALLASYVPARRAAGVDPVDALRWE